MAEYLDVVAPGYQFGGWRRNCFLNYILYERFQYFDISLFRRDGRITGQDEWMKLIFERGLIAPADYVRYRQVFETYPEYDPELWDMTNEQLYYALHKLRENFLERQAVSGLKLELIREPRRHGSGREPRGYGSDREPRGQGSIRESSGRGAIWQSDGQLRPELRRGRVFQQEKLEALLGERQTVLLAVNDLSWVGSAIAFAAELLIQGKQVFMIVKEESLAPVLTLDEYEAVSLGLTGRLDCITDPFAGRGIDFSCLESSGKLQAAISRKEVFLLGFGEDILLSVHNLQIPAMVYTQAQPPEPVTMNRLTAFGGSA